MLVSTSCSAVQNIRRHCQAEVEENPSSVFPSMCTPPPPPGDSAPARQRLGAARPHFILRACKPKTQNARLAPCAPRSAGRPDRPCLRYEDSGPVSSCVFCMQCTIRGPSQPVYVLQPAFMFCSRPLCSAAGLYVLQPASMFCSSPEPGKPSPRAHGIIRCSNRNCHISLHEMVHGIHPNVPATQPLASAFQHTTRTPSMHQRGLAKRGQRTR